jgi:hypothetical protein
MDIGGDPAEPTAFQIRRARQATRDFSTVKSGLQKLCREQRLIDLIEDLVYRCSIIAVEASLLASMHILRLLDSNHIEDGEALPEMDDTFFNQCVSAIANLNGTQNNNNASLIKTLYYYYVPQKPEAYVNVDRTPPMAQILVIIAHQARQNFVVSTEQTLYKRLHKWIRLCINQYSQFQINQEAEEEEEYFSTHGPYNGKSIAGVMVRCCLEDVTVVEIMNQYKRIRERPIPPVGINWMQDLCTFVKQNLGITPQNPLQVSKQPEVYIPFLARMLQDIENSQADHDFEASGEPNRLFSLLPQKKIKPLYISINTTILEAMHNWLSSFEEFPVDVDDIGISLWDYYFDLKCVTRGNKEFENFIMTDGLSASVTVSREKRVVVGKYNG